jgi:hypothetical protein
MIHLKEKTQTQINFMYLVCVWYHVGYARIIVIHRDFLKVTLCGFCKIMVSHRNSDISNVTLQHGLFSNSNFKYFKLDFTCFGY